MEQDGRTERAGRRVYFRLGQVERIFPFDITAAHVVAYDHPHDFARRVGDESQFRLGHAPLVSVSAVVQQPDLLFRLQPEADAAAWLRAHTPPDAVVLGAYQTGNYVAGRTTRPVVVGHWAETVAFDDKDASVARFFDPQTPDSWRRGLLARHDVSYLWHGPRERALGAWQPEQAAFLEPVYRQDGIVIYRVAR